MKKTIISMLCLECFGLCVFIAPLRAMPKTNTYALPQPQEVQLSQNQVLMTVRVQRHYKVGQAVDIPVSLKNLRSVRITRYTFAPYGLSLISLKRKRDGVEYDVPLTEFGQQYNPANPIQNTNGRGLRPLQPGETETVVINISRLYKITAPGTYEVMIKRAINDFQEDAFVVQNKPIQFIVDSPLKN